MSNGMQGLSLEEILAGELDEQSLPDDTLGHWVEVTPRALAIHNLNDCKEQLERWREKPLKLAQAAKSVHLAMQAALTDALSGSAGIGAFDDRLRAKYLTYFEKSREGDAISPDNDRVLRFEDLLERAIEHPMEWSGQRLEISPDEIEKLSRLTSVRDRVEHPRPGTFLVEPRYIAQLLPVAARLTLKLLDVCIHHYDEGDREFVQTTVTAVDALCAKIE